MKSNSYSGKFIVLEGIDGAGCETQTKLLFNYFKKQRKALERLYYPDYEGPVGKLIHQYLYKIYNFPVDVQFLLYCADFLKDREKINRFLEQGKVVVCDRYFTSTIVYQGAQGIPIKKALKFAEFFNIPKPDLIIYLKVSPEISMKRKYKEKRNLDRNEANKKFLAKVAKLYERLIKNQTFSKWIIINGERSIKEVFKDIKNIITKRLKV